MYFSTIEIITSLVTSYFWNTYSTDNLSLSNHLGLEVAAVD